MPETATRQGRRPPVPRGATAARYGLIRLRQPFGLYRNGCGDPRFSTTYRDPVNTGLPHPVSAPRYKSTFFLQWPEKTCLYLLDRWRGDAIILRQGVTIFSTRWQRFLQGVHRAGFRRRPSPLPRFGPFLRRFPHVRECYPSRLNPVRWLKWERELPTAGFRIVVFRCSRPGAFFRFRATQTAASVRLRGCGAFGGLTAVGGFDHCFLDSPLVSCSRWGVTECRRRSSESAEHPQDDLPRLFCALVWSFVVYKLLRPGLGNWERPVGRVSAHRSLVGDQQDPQDQSSDHQ